MLRVDVIEMVVVFIFIHVVDLRIVLKGKEYEANLTVMEGGQINCTQCQHSQPGRRLAHRRHLLHQSGALASLS